MKMIISPFGQLLGLWAPSSGLQDVFTSIVYVFTYPGVDDHDDNKPAWPTWAVGALFRGARCRSRDILVKGRKHP